MLKNSVKLCKILPGLTHKAKLYLNIKDTLDQAQFYSTTLINKILGISQHQRPQKEKQNNLQHMESILKVSTKKSLDHR